VNIARKVLLGSGCLAMACLGSVTAAAGPLGSIDTTRFGFDGTIQRFDSEADARAGANQVGDDIIVEDRDIGLFINSFDGVGGAPGDRNIIMGPWWFTQDEFFGSGQGRAGWGNDRGNTGVGFLQLFDTDASTDTSVDMSFSGFDGSAYTQFNLALTGENATTADDFARLSAIDNVNDGGRFLDYVLELTALGLNGQPTTIGGLPFIEAIGEPTAVTGSFSGLFELTENQTSPDNQGFYLFDFTLDLDNYAYENRADLTPNISLDGGNTFFDSTFQTSSFTAQAEIPTPATLGLLATGLLGLGFAVRRRRTH